jgi:D-arabinose 1-dehydrogenase-like Zn-dependent alcohol dehydrogenase
MIPIPSRTNAPCFLPAALLAAILCASCAGPLTQTEEQPGERHAIYTCRGIGQVEVLFSEPMGIARLTRQGRTIHLRRQRSGEVLIYSDGANSVRRAGNDITVDLAGGEPTRAYRARS